VTLHDGRRIDASVKAFDRTTAIALLKIKSEGLRAVEFAEPASIRQGSIAVLVSNPAGLNQSCSVGFVTGLDRSIVVGGACYMDMLQTSAAVQSGDGGGLLANSRGLVVGMIHSRYVPDGVEPDQAGFMRAVPRMGHDFLPAGGPAVGFATPATTLKFVAERLIKSGKVQRGWAGIGLRRTAQSTQVVEIVAHGPAFNAGIRPGDSVIEWDGQAATDLQSLRRRVVDITAPKTVRVRVQRGNVVLDLDVKLELGTAASPRSPSRRSWPRGSRGASVSRRGSNGPATTRPRISIPRSSCNPRSTARPPSPRRPSSTSRSTTASARTTSGRA
jgi:serine protease Do